MEEIMMNKMKKLLAVLCALMMVAALAACGGGDTKGGGTTGGEPTALDLYNQANAKVAELDNVEYNMNIDMHMTEPTRQTEIDMTMGGNMKQVKVDDNYQMSFDMNMEIPGQGAMDIAMYYADGYFYYNMPAAGMKYKEAMSVEDALGEMNASGMADLDESMVVDQSVTEEGGNKVVNLTLDGTKMMDYVSEVGGDMTASLQGGEVKLSNVTVKAVMDADANISTYEMTMPMEVTTQGVTMTMDMVLSMEVVATGDAVTVVLPDDLDTYQEMAA